MNFGQVPKSRPVQTNTFIFEKKDVSSAQQSQKDFQFFEISSDTVFIKWL